MALIGFKQWSEDSRSSKLHSKWLTLLIQVCLLCLEVFSTQNPTLYIRQMYFLTNKND